MKKIIVGLIIIVSIAAICFASISNNWKKRAADSIINKERIRSEILAKHYYDKDIEIDKHYNYFLILERAYSDHLKKELKNILFQKENDREFYTIVLDLGTKDEEKLVILRFVYNSKSEEVVGYNIGSLPEGWNVSTAISPPPRLIAILDSDEDGFFFNLDNPLVSWVWVDDKVYKMKDKED